MENIKEIIIGVLGAVIVAGGSALVAYFKSLQNKLGVLEAKNKEKEAKINHLHNGFRDEVKAEITALKEQVSLIIQYLKGDK